MDDPKKQLVEKLKTANNVLVTVSRNPSVDQLASCIGLTLLLNKQDKHAAAVFSGQVPSTLEFLQPEETFEKNTDSLRDFIIALDKSKADKLRYKVEDDFVRIFITPYKTSISQADLEFSEGDFNVDVVITLGVREQTDLDEAITAHGRILHDATVASVNIAMGSELGTINWYDPGASSLCELITELAEAIGDNLIDQQIATALLTGIVAETDRFSNEKTSSQTMSASARLMAAGANQQLVVNRLQGNNSPVATSAPGEAAEPGTLRINHPGDQPTDSGSAMPSNLASTITDDPKTKPTTSLSSGSSLITEPPTLSSIMTANSQADGLDPSSDPLSLPSATPPTILSHDSHPSSEAPGTPSLRPGPGTLDNSLKSEVDSKQSADKTGERTLSELEAAVGRGEPKPQGDDLSTVRGEIKDAIVAGNNATSTDKPIAALNAQPLGDNLHDKSAEPGPLATPLSVENAPPPVPPPIPFQFGDPSPPEDDSHH
ncbi:MAG TPA: hypothetical protein VLF79_01075 [Candidatus Saccharimonadales bacterium]|nr:hypothetical protein [Candidatus Saccharimonadales bacterium]